ncbi:MULTISPECIES: DNA repair protein RecN [unclassified Meiothermus]|uniref:DNA repair protein RecN n=1 Tax=unclassified Meiothermus TaxID=370471 RepID=UPI000D7CFFC7|nr:MULTISPECIES: DNA repair protein RecN [unclassified Meiothermus]PZA08891.1 DNA repair protein RecN [Meiothermus sp. Pnk-1]RYM33758.1 DNA repair protein RecN [Meiothermus sp. PNK-Is4]
MLERLEVKNLAVLEEVALEFGPGLTVLTGETGAGKSVLVDALSLLLGERAEGMIRPGAEALLVTAWFDGRVLSRRVTHSRSIPRVDGEVVSLRELAEETSRHLTIHAQHAALSLLGRKAQRELLDALVDPALLQAYREAYTHHQTLLAEQGRLEAAARERERRLDVLSFQLKEIEAAKIIPGEEAELKREAEKLRHAESLRERVGLASSLLSGEHDSVGQIAQALRELKAAAKHDEGLGGLGRDLEAALDGLKAVARELEDYLDSLEADPHRLEAVETRLALLERLQRKYGDSLEEVLAFAEAARRELAELERADERLAALAQEIQESRQELLHRGHLLSVARAQAAERLSKEATREIRTLGMPEARFRVELQPLGEPGPEGLEEVHWLFSANPGIGEAPLERAASGGELSRVMLALVLLTGVEARTVIFDEVDAGVGGEAAWQVAERLARLAQTRQVLVVTHLPQIAARAQRHFQVVKERGKVQVKAIEGEERVRELARMLSGSYSETALEHARELLAGAPLTPQSGVDPFV